MKSNTIQMVLSSSSLAGNITSNPIPLDQIYGFAIQAVWTGVPTGTLKLQASSDSPSRQTQTSLGGPDVITNWTDVANSSVALTGSSGNYMWNFTSCMFRYVRLVYTSTSGTGSITAEISAKGV